MRVFVCLVPLLVLSGGARICAQSEPPLFPPGSDLPQPSSEQPSPLPEDPSQAGIPLELAPEPEIARTVTRRSQLANSVGRMVQISGTWNDEGQLGPYIRLDGQFIFVRPRLGGAADLSSVLNKFDRKKVVMTGRLRFYIAPEGVISSGSNISQTPPTHYFFYIDEVRVTEK